MSLRNGENQVINEAMRNKRLIIIGAGQTAEQIFHLASGLELFEQIVFAVDQRYRAQGTFCDSDVLELDSVLNTFDPMQDSAFIAMSWNRLNHHRTAMYDRIKACNVSLANLIADTASVYKNASIGDNVWISELAIVGCSSIVGNNVFVQPGASVLHNTVINDHSFIGGSSVIGGNSKIGTGSFVGLGAIIFNDLIIGKNCIIGAGATVRKDLPDYSIVYGPQSMIVQADKNSVLDRLTVR